MPKSSLGVEPDDRAPGRSGCSDACAARLAAVEVVLFDLDGTLVDTIDMIRASMRHATATVLGEALPDEVLMRNVGVPLRVQMGEFSEVHAEELLRVYREHNALVHDEMIREYPGTHETLDRLSSAGLRMGVVTSKSRPVAERALDLFDLGGYFEIVVACEDTAVHKPDPFPLLWALDRLGASADACAYVGDSPHDVAAARGAGAVAIGAVWGAFEPDAVACAGPDLVIESISELIELVCPGRE